MPVYIPIDALPFEVKEMNGSRTEKFEGYRDKKVRARRIFEMDWYNRIRFINIWYLQPYPDIARVYATDFDVKPQPPTGKDVIGNAAYEMARVTVDYQSLDREPEEEEEEDPGEEPEGPYGPNVEVELDFAHDAVTLPQGSFQFADGTKADFALKRIGMVVFRVTVEDIPSIDRVAIANLIGSISSGQLFGFPAGHVLLDGVRARQKRRSFEADTGWHVTGEWIIRTENWNHLPHPKTGRFELVTSRQGGNTIYETADIASFITSYVGGL